MVQKSKLLAWRKILISPFCKKAEKDRLIICDNSSTKEQWALKEHDSAFTKF